LTQCDYVVETSCSDSKNCIAHDMKQVHSAQQASARDTVILSMRHVLRALARTQATVMANGLDEF